MARITELAPFCLALFAVNLAAPALAEPSPPVRQAIKAYQSKDYKGAIGALAHASAKDELAHYYRALCYQQLSDFKEAETEYLWDYNNARDKDLTYKSWQGLQGLSKIRLSHQSMAVDLEKDKAEIAAKPSAAPDTSVHVKLPEWKVEVTPGCGRHHHY